MLFLFKIPLLLAVIVSAQDQLPEPGECGQLNAQYLYNQKIITQPDEFPWMGRLVYRINDESDSYTCLAVLISQRYMLANAHCMNDNQLPHAVVLGDWDTANKVSDVDCDESERCAPVPLTYDIEEIIVHPNYNRSRFANDFAMLRLNGTVTYSKHIRSICLPTKDVAQQDFVAQHLELTGWYSANFVAERKQTKHFVHMMSLKVCEGIYGPSTVLNRKTHLCGITCRDGAPYVGGSALMGVKTLDAAPVHYYLVALVTYGPSRCTSMYPDVMFRIDAYLDWIKENIY